MEVGQANLENLDPMGKFLRELANQNCGRGSFHTVDRRHCGAAPGNRGLFHPIINTPSWKLMTQIFVENLRKITILDRLPPAGQARARVEQSYTLNYAMTSEDSRGVGGVDREKLMLPWWQEFMYVEEFIHS